MIKDVKQDNNTVTVVRTVKGVEKERVYTFETREKAFIKYTSFVQMQIKEDLKCLIL